MEKDSLYDERFSLLTAEALVPGQLKCYQSIIATQGGILGFGPEIGTVG